MTYSLEKFRRLAYDTLKYERFQHTIGVEVFAHELAKRFGLDTEAASLAALTHDLAKEYPLDEQIEKAKKWGLIYYPEDIENPGVIHGRLAAYILEKEHNIEDKDILNAVANHTLGRPGMSDLEMLIYSADLTEPGRDFPGVDNLRQKLYHDLRDGTLACIEHILNHLRESNKPIHPLTLLTYEDLKKANNANNIKESY
jgi:predicted HD superfamily hydrolase involved in NAD metabolism